MKRSTVLTIAALVVTGLAIPSAANAAGPPLPVSASGKNVNVWATGVSIPTQFAFAGKNVFIAGAVEGKARGGIYVRKPGSKVARRIPDSPKAAFGVAWAKKKLYASIGKSIMVYGKWNGRKFLKKRVLFRGPKGNFTGFNGIAFGPNGRLYAGISLSPKHDRTSSPTKFGNSVVSIRKNGTGIKTVSKGLRQPWMLTFTKGDRSPTVSELGQDTPKGTKAPDLLVKAKLGSNFGFPSCTWASAASCKGFTKPLLIFKNEDPSPSPTGLASKGKTIYVAMFGGIKGSGPEVIKTDSTGAKPQPVLTGFAAPVVGVGSHKGFLYASDLTGQIYRVHD